MAFWQDQSVVPSHSERIQHCSQTISINLFHLRLEKQKTDSIIIKILNTSLVINNWCIHNRGDIFFFFSQPPPKLKATSACNHLFHPGSHKQCFNTFNIMFLRILKKLELYMWLSGLLCLTTCLGSSGDQNMSLKDLP